AAPLVAAAVVLAVALGGRLDLLQLGDDAARSLGVRVGTTRVVLVSLAVLLAAAAVSVAGPLGFVGLCAPALMRIVRRWLPVLRFHRVLLVASALCAALLVLLADVLLRWLFNSADAVEVPTGVITTALGAIFLIMLSQGMRTGPADASPALVRSWSVGRRHPAPVVLVGIAVLAGTSWIALLIGDVWL